MNPLYNQFNNNNDNDVINRLNQFKAMYNGDPRAEVQSLLNSGRMSQQQFNQLANMANQLRRFIR